jgi:hypothetical protein
MAILEKVLGGGAMPLVGKLVEDGVGIIPSLIKDYRDDRKEDKEKKEQRRAAANIPVATEKPAGMKKGGMVKSSASKRADGCAQRGKTRGKMV